MLGEVFKGNCPPAFWTTAGGWWSKAAEEPAEICLAIRDGFSSPLPHNISGESQAVGGAVEQPQEHLTLSHILKVTNIH